MSENKPERTEISELGEFGLIERLTSGHQTVQPSTVKGVGDDAAILDTGGHKYLVVTTDMLVEGIHFDLVYTPLKHLGYKSIISNLSDVCAMNGIPGHVCCSIALSNRFSVEAIEELYSGIYAACKQYNVDLIGGDTTSSRQGLIISVTALGEVEKEKVTYRSGAKPGDILCVTGDLGAAYLGLQLLEREKQLFLSQPDVKPDLEGQNYIVGRELKPEARLDIIQLFKKHELVPTSMIDISDGLASDVFHLCKSSDTGVVIEEGKVPIHHESEMMALKFKLDPITCALNGGEDYELLFTVDQADLEKVRTMPGIYIIGEMKMPGFGKKLLTTGDNLHDLKAQGWTAF